jgi:predicted permease
MSLGAERARVIRQLLAESALLGSIGAALGVAFAWMASRLLLAMVSSGSTLLPIQVTPDARVLAFAIAVTAVTVLLFGAAPALRATGLDLSTSMKTRGVVTSAGRNRLARGLVVGQVAVSLLLLAGAGLFLRSLANLINVNVGFDRQNVVRMYIDPRPAGYRTDARLVSATDRIVEAVSALPGVRAAAFAQDVLDGGGSSTTDIRVPGLPDSAPHPQTDLNRVSPQYLDVMKLPILYGRGLTAQDTASSRKVAVINQTMVRTHFGGAWPIGRTFSVGDDESVQDVEVVGVMKDAKYMELEEAQMPAVMFPYAQQPQHYIYSFVVRYSGDAESLLPAIRRAIAGVDPNLPVSDVRTLAQMVDGFTVNRRVVAQLSMFFGLLAALLASIGIYGVMSYGIARRTNEFGIRMALGAKRRDVLWSVLRETLSLAVAGIAIGVALAYEGGHLIEKLLFGVDATNPGPLALAIAAMLLVALLAAWLPARRATKIDPSVALRWE